jgi:hypothetical protein
MPGKSARRATTAKVMKKTVVIKALPKAVPRTNPLTVELSYLFSSTSQSAIGGQGNPFVWNVTVPGYPIVNIIFGLKGAPGKSYNIQVRHSFPLGIYTIDSRSGTLPPGGIAEVEFAGLRPRRPELNVIAVSFGDNANFDTIAATIYGTIA